MVEMMEAAAKNFRRSEPVRRSFRPRAFIRWKVGWKLPFVRTKVIGNVIKIGEIARDAGRGNTAVRRTAVGKRIFGLAPMVRGKAERSRIFLISWRKGCVILVYPLISSILYKFYLALLPALASVSVLCGIGSGDPIKISRNLLSPIPTQQISPFPSLPLLIFSAFSIPKQGIENPNSVKCGFEM